MEKTERETMERYNTIKSKYNELEGEHERLKVVCKQKERDLDGIKKVKIKFYTFFFCSPNRFQILISFDYL